MIESAPLGGLSEEQRARVEIALGTLNHARGADLVAMEPVELVVLVERLRGSLHDSLRVITELAEPAHPGTPPDQ